MRRGYRSNVNSLFTIMLPTLFIPAAFLQGEELTRNDISQELRKHLPDGWQLQRTEHYWLVRREKPVTLYNGINLPGFESEEEFREFIGEGLKDDYVIIVRFGDKVTPMQYETWQAENERANELQEELARGLRGIRRKFDSFAPVGDEEKARVAEYQAAVAKIKRHQLPDYFHGQHSIYIETTRSWSLSFLDGDVAAECQRVNKLVTRRFTPYEENP